MDSPNPDSCARATVRGAASRLQRYRDDPQYQGFTKSALAERVIGIPLHPERGSRGWWKVGMILDAFSDEELDVWYRPRGLAVSVRARPAKKEPPAMPRGPVYYDGVNGTWRDSATGNAVSRPSER